MQNMAGPAHITAGTRKDLHSAERNFALLEQCGLKVGTVCNEYALSADVLKEAKQLFVELNPGAAKPVLFIQPFTSTPHKNWPLEKYLALARHWESRGGKSFLAAARRIVRCWSLRARQVFMFRRGLPCRFRRVGETFRPSRSAAIRDYCIWAWRWANVW